MIVSNEEIYFFEKKKRRVRIYGRFSLCQFNPIKPELYQARESLVGGGGGRGHFCPRQTNPYNSFSVHS